MKPNKLNPNASKLQPDAMQAQADESNLLDFQRYQLAFTQHLRQPKSSPKPARISAKGMAVYTEIVFNNILSSVSACFPVAQKALGTRAWQKLIRDFFIHHQAQTPIFREIPHELVCYLDARQTTNGDLPAWLNNLAHYEWIELAVSMSNAEIGHREIDSTTNINPNDDLLERNPKLAVASELLQYDYAVHKISKKNKPSQTEATYLLVFRDATNKVQFVELNAVTFRLLQLTEHENLTSKQALSKLAAEINHPNTQAVIEFGLDMLRGLKAQGAVL